MAALWSGLGKFELPYPYRTHLGLAYDLFQTLQQSRFLKYYTGAQETLTCAFIYHDGIAEQEKRLPNGIKLWANN